MNNDLPVQETAKNLYSLVKSGMKCFLKWTCPSCGERVCADNPLEMADNGYQLLFAPAYEHSERLDGTPCGTIIDTHTALFNCMIICEIPSAPKEAAPTTTISLN